MHSELHSPPPQRRAAFTLVEVVIVVAIIAVVTAILIPVAGEVRRRGIRLRCMGNLRQVGLAAAAYTVDHRFHLPTHHRDSALAFDTFLMQRDTGQPVNLGLLVDRVSSPSALYCPSQDVERSPDIAFDSPQNRWRWRSGAGAGPGAGPGPGGPGPGPGPSEPAGPNASFAARFRSDAGGVEPAWTMLNYSNKVIYSDFVGVDDWPGRGRFTGPLRAPHDSRGYNRLFGDGSVLWADSSTLNARRPVGPAEPTLSEMRDYFDWLDVMP